MDRADFTLISLLVHVPFITAWIGLVMLDGFAAFAPGIDDRQRPRLIMWSQKFTLLAIVVIMVTGIWQTMDNPFIRVGSYSDLTNLRENTLYGSLLFWKHVFVFITFALTLFVRFRLAPRAGGGDISAGGGAAAQGSSLLKPMIVLNVLACLGALLLASRMVIELH